MLDYDPSYEQYRVGVYNDQAYYNIDGYYFVRDTSPLGGTLTDQLIYVPNPPASIAAA